VSQELLRLWHGDNSRTQERERPQLEVDTSGLVKDKGPKRLSACYSKLHNVRNRVSLTCN
jgi:hypothetical protein